MREPSEEWLEKTNAKFAAEGAQHRQRPWLAWRQWAIESNQSLGLSDLPATRIFEWFKENTKADSQQIRNLYVGAFYYDAEIWPLVLPVFYGTVELRPLEQLPSMPDRVKQRLADQTEAWSGLMYCYADCLDAALLPQNCAGDTTLNAFSQQLLASGSETLSAAAELLLLKNPNPKALGTSRFATEIFLKAYLAAKDGVTEEDAKNKYGHKLSKLIQRVLQVTPGSDFAEIEPKLTVYPPVEERYESNQWPILQLWGGYSVALHTAATVLRLLTGEDSRKAMLS